MGLDKRIIIIDWLIGSVTMADVFDVAQYILSECGPMTTWKLQKLVYYSQAWGLVWDDESLFEETIEAWANGPVVPDLYECHKGQFVVSNIENGDPDLLEDYQRETINAVIASYNDKSANWLSELTHGEAPWLNARERAGLAPGERGDSEITLDDLAEYYGGL